MNSGLNLILESWKLPEKCCSSPTMCTSMHLLHTRSSMEAVLSAPWVWQDDTWYWTDLFKMNLRSPQKSQKRIVDHVLADYRQSKSKPSCKKHWQSANDANISLVEPNAQDSLRTQKTQGRTTRWPLFSIFDSDACHHHQPPRKSESWMSRGPRQRLPRELGRKLRNDSTVETLKRRVSTSSVRLKRPCAGLALSSAQAILDMLFVAKTSSYTAISH